jgi:ABC-2 type transport system ATP-binding protein
MSAVVTEALVVRFGSLVAVDEVSLEVARGEVFGLLGPNGADRVGEPRLLRARDRGAAA